MAVSRLATEWYRQWEITDNAPSDDPRFPIALTVKQKLPSLPAVSRLTSRQQTDAIVGATRIFGQQFPGAREIRSNPSLERDALADMFGPRFSVSLRCATGDCNVEHNDRRRARYRLHSWLDDGSSRRDADLRAAVRETAGLASPLCRSSRHGPQSSRSSDRRYGWHVERPDRLGRSASRERTLRRGGNVCGRLPGARPLGSIG